MKYAILFFVFLTTGLLSAQTTTITVNAKGCPALKLYSFNGAGFNEEADFAKNDAGVWTLEVPVSDPVFRYVGSRANDVLPLVLSADEQPTVTATCGQMRKATTADSPLNTRYQEVKDVFQGHNTTFSVTMRAWQQANQTKDSVAIKEALGDLRKLDEEKATLLKETKAFSPLIARVVSLNNYRSFLTSNNGRFDSELDYFANTYFEFVDLTDEGYGDLPWTYEGSRNFTNTLGGAIKNEQLADILKAIHGRWPAGSRAKLFALSGSFASLLQKKHPAALPIAEAIEAEFAAKFPVPVKQIGAQSAGLRTFAIGAEAPTFTAPTPEGEMISLESLRGKVVLIDFWASWCGPCRRENPNVVKMYNKYKDQGFEILAVSLDKTKARWVKAIADDQLTWLHVSDLKGWKSEYGRLYGVSSIPQTVLLDKEGKILARNLRGAALEQKVGEVLSGKK